MTPGSATLGSEPPHSYEEMLVLLHPRPIRTDAEAEATTELMDTLLDLHRPLTPDERDLLALLGLLIAAWEEGRYELPDVPPREIVRALMEDNGLRQKDLVGPVFPTESVASAVLSGKRRLTYDFVERLAAFFHVAPSVFFARGT